MAMTRAEALTRRRAAYRAERSGELVNVEFQGLDAALRNLGSSGKQIDRARRRALAKLLTFARREVARTVARTVGISQKNFIALARLSAQRRQTGAVELWIGTNPVAAQYLGRVAWRRSWVGARAGTRQFQGAWSWVGKPGAKTGAAVMRRTAGSYQVDARTRSGIAEVKVDIHAQIKARMPEIQAAVLARFRVLLAQELNYALKVERAA